MCILYVQAILFYTIYLKYEANKYDIIMIIFWY